MQKSIFVMETPDIKEKVTELTKGEFSYQFMNGQRFILLPEILEKKKFRSFLTEFEKIISPYDFLSLSEIEDVETSLEEIIKGRAKKFKSVNAFLKELKSR